FAAVAVERDRLFAFLDQPPVDDVEHLEKGHIGSYIWRVVQHEPAWLFSAFLPPNMQRQSHLLIAPLCKRHVLERQRLLVQHRILIRALVFPCDDVRELGVVPPGFAVRRLIFLAQVASARLLALQSVYTHQLAQLEKVGDSASFLERLVELLTRSDNVDVAPEFFTYFGDSSESGFQARFVANHSATIPQHLAQLLVDRVDGPLALYAEQLADPRFHFILCLGEFGMVDADFIRFRCGYVVAQRVRNDEVSVGQSLHQGARAEPVRSVVREISLAQHKEPVDRAHQVVVDPQPSHGVVNRRVNPHRNLVRILAGDPLIHLKQVAVLLADGVLAQSLNRVGEIQVYAEPRITHTEALVADLLGGTRGHVARHEISKTRIPAFQVIVAVGFRYVIGTAAVAFLFGDPDAPVVAKRFAHQSQLGLVEPADRNARRMNLGKTGIRECSTTLVCPPDGGGVAVLGVGRQVKDVAVSACRQHYGIGGVGFDLAGDQVPGDNAAGPPIDDDQIEHFAPRVHADLALVNLALERLIGAEQELLSGLAPRVKGSRDLSAAKGPVIKVAAVL